MRNDRMALFVLRRANYLKNSRLFILYTLTDENNI